MYTSPRLIEIDDDNWMKDDVRVEEEDSKTLSKNIVTSAENEISLNETLAQIFFFNIAIIYLFFFFFGGG